MLTYDEALDYLYSFVDYGLVRAEKYSPEVFNLTRMVAPALQDGDGRIDYGCHFGAHLPTPRGPTVVVAPGAEIAYSFTGSRYQRIQGDVRLGLDFARGDWVTGVYLVPYGGWYRPMGEERGHVTGGVAIDLSMIYMVPKKQGSRDR